MAGLRFRDRGVGARGDADWWGGGGIGDSGVWILGRVRWIVRSRKEGLHVGVLYTC